MASIAEVIQLEVPLQLSSLRQSLPPALDAEGAPTEHPLVADFSSAAERLRAAAETFDLAVAAADGNAHLSPAGKAKAARDAVLELQAAGELLRATTMADLDRSIVAIESVRMTPPAKVDLAEATRAELRAREIRDSVRSLDPLERELLFRGELDPVTRQAFVDGPPTLYRARPGDAATLVPFVSAEAKADYFETLLDAQHPEVSAQLRDLRSVRRVLAGLLASVLRGAGEVARAANIRT